MTEPRSPDEVRAIFDRIMDAAGDTSPDDLVALVRAELSEQEVQLCKAFAVDEAVAKGWYSPGDALAKWCLDA